MSLPEHVVMLISTVGNYPVYYMQKGDISVSHCMDLVKTSNLDPNAERLVCHKDYKAQDEIDLLVGHLSTPKTV